MSVTTWQVSQLLHRASLSLQVAAAAELRHDTTPRDFALANFGERYWAGTLYDPDGQPARSMTSRPVTGDGR